MTGYNLLHTLTPKIGDKIYVLLYPDDHPVGLDKDSGGYPYRAYSLSGIHYWYNEAEVKRYRDMFSKENFKLVRLTDVHAMEVVE